MRKFKLLATLAILTLISCTKKEDKPKPLIVNIRGCEYQIIRIGNDAQIRHLINCTSEKHKQN